MKLTFSGWVAGLALLTAWISPTPARAQLAAPEQAPRNAVMVVVNRVDVNSEIQKLLNENNIETRKIGQDVVDQIQRDLTAGGLPVVRRDLMERLLREQNLPYEGIVDPTTAAKAGKAVGARFVVLATVDANLKKRILETEYNSKIHFDVVDVQTGLNVKLSSNLGYSEGKCKIKITDVPVIVGRGTSSDYRDHPLGRSLADASKKLAGCLKDLTPATWEVKAIVGDRVIVEGGSNANHKAGMRLEIVHVMIVEKFPIETLVAVAEVAQVTADRTMARIVRLEDPKVPVAEGHIARMPRPAVASQN